jgi:hypothetical protein
MLLAATNGDPKNCNCLARTSGDASGVLLSYSFEPANRLHYPISTHLHEFPIPVSEPPETLYIDFLSPVSRTSENTISISYPGSQLSRIEETILSSAPDVGKRRRVSREKSTNLSTVLEDCPGRGGGNVFLAGYPGWKWIITANQLLVAG